MMPVRVSIKAYLIPYLDGIGAELGTADYTEIVNHLLRESKRQNTANHISQFSNQLIKNDDDSLADSLLELMPA